MSADQNRSGLPRQWHARATVTWLPECNSPSGA
jgi:hypothetical protein